MEALSPMANLAIEFITTFDGLANINQMSQSTNHLDIDFKYVAHPTSSILALDDDIVEILEEYKDKWGFTYRVQHNYARGGNNTIRVKKE